MCADIEVVHVAEGRIEGKEGGERGWITNQIVWTKWKNNWLPAVIIDPMDDWIGLEPVLDRHQHVLWLGDGRVSQVPERNLRDFCLSFTQCYPTMPEAVTEKERVQRDRYEQAVSLSIKLALARAKVPKEELPRGKQALIEWASREMHNYIELSVSQSFYLALQKTNKEKNKDKMQQQTEDHSDSSTSGVEDDPSTSSKIRVDNKKRQILEEVEKAAHASTNRRKFQKARKTVPKPEAVKKEKVSTPKPAPKAEPPSPPKPKVIGKAKKSIKKPIVKIEEEAGSSKLETRRSSRSKSPVKDKKAKIEKILKEVKEEEPSWQENKQKPERKPRIKAEIKAKEEVKLEPKPKPAPKSRKRKLEEEREEKPAAKKARVSTPGRKRASVGGEVDIDKLKVPLDMGWKREVSLRKPPSKKIGDVYYHPPNTKKQRSMTEILALLEKCSSEKWTKGLTAENFSFRELVRTEHDNERVHEAGINTFGRTPGASSSTKSTPSNKSTPNSKAKGTKKANDTPSGRQKPGPKSSKKKQKEEPEEIEFSDLLQDVSLIDKKKAAPVDEPMETGEGRDSPGISTKDEQQMETETGKDKPCPDVEPTTEQIGDDSPSGSDQPMDAEERTDQPINDELEAAADEKSTDGAEQSSKDGSSDALTGSEQPMDAEESTESPPPGDDRPISDEQEAAVEEQSTESAEQTKEGSSDDAPSISASGTERNSTEESCLSPLSTDQLTIDETVERPIESPPSESEARDLPVPEVSTESPETSPTVETAEKTETVSDSTEAAQPISIENDAPDAEEKADSDGINAATKSCDDAEPVDGEGKESPAESPVSETQNQPETDESATKSPSPEPTMENEEPAVSDSNEPTQEDDASSTGFSIVDETEQKAGPEGDAPAPEPSKSPVSEPFDLPDQDVSAQSPVPSAEKEELASDSPDAPEDDKPVSTLPTDEKIEVSEAPSSGDEVEGTESPVTEEAKGEDPEVSGDAPTVPCAENGEATSKDDVVSASGFEKAETETDSQENGQRTDAMPPLFTED